MKTTSYIIAAVLSLQVSLLYAGNNETRTSSPKEAVTITITSLAPVTPPEATFEDATETNDFLFDFSDFSPVVPMEADFSDNEPERINDYKLLAPVTPAEADFDPAF